MAEKRMISKMVVDSDAFLDMPLTAQALYFHLAVRADDEGFINNSKKIQRIIGANEDDFKMLKESNFIITFDSGVIVIKHWKLHNNISKGRKKETAYQEEREQLIEKENGVYTLKHKNADSEIAEIKNKSETEEKSAVENAEDTFDYNTSDLALDNESDKIKEYAKTIFDIYSENNLPCWNNNFMAFYMSDFKNSLSEIRKLKLDFNDVVQAVKNYVEVVKLSREGLSWFNRDQMSFLTLCKNDGIRKFLSDEFKIESFYKDKSKVMQSDSSLNDKISL